MPHPEENPLELFGFISNCEHEWAALIDKYTYLHSVLDRDASNMTSAAGSNAFVCTRCSGSSHSFASQKALDQHCRRVHGIKSSIREFVDGSGICPVCETNFHTRLRVLAHLSDKRRTKCSSALQSGTFERLPSTEVTRLDQADAQARRAARKNGHTHALAIRSAVTKSDKRIDHVRM